MIETIKIIEMVISILLILVILIQPKKSSLNLTTFGNEWGWKFERRWPEKTLHQLTIIIWSIFIILALVYFFMA